MSFWCLQFPPKNERKQIDLGFHSSNVEFVPSFLEEASFPLFLAFKNESDYSKHTMGSKRFFWSCIEMYYESQSLWVDKCTLVSWQMHFEISLVNLECDWINNLVPLCNTRYSVGPTTDKRTDVWSRPSCIYIHFFFTFVYLYSMQIFSVDSKISSKKA